MSQSTRRPQYTWSAQTEPYLIEAFLAYASIEVFERQVEITVDFGDLPEPRLATPKKFISRDPAVVAFHQRVFDGVRKRHAACDTAIAEREGRAA